MGGNTEDCKLGYSRKHLLLDICRIQKEPLEDCHACSDSKHLFQFIGCDKTKRSLSRQCGLGGVFARRRLENARPTSITIVGLFFGNFPPFIVLEETLCVNAASVLLMLPIRAFAVSDSVHRISIRVAHLCDTEAVTRTTLKGGSPSLGHVSRNDRLVLKDMSTHSAFTTIQWKCLTQLCEQPFLKIVPAP